MVVLLSGSVVTVILAMLLVSILWIAYAPIAARRFCEMPWFPSRSVAISPDDYPEGIFDSENVSFRTPDGVRLTGTYLPTTAAERMGAVVFCHELRGNRSTALAFTGGLRDQGFDILAFDFRDHGESTTSPGYMPLPWATCREAMDVKAAIDFCCQRDSALAGRIVLFGLSRGASAALYVAAADSRVQAAVLDGIVFTQQVQLFLIRRFMYLHLKWFPQLSRLPDCLLGLLVFWCNQIIQKRKDCRILPISNAARQMRKPVLLIHGARDSFVPLETVHSLRKRMRSRSRLWVVPQARHNETVHEAGDAYRRRVAQFLVRHLGVLSGAANAAPQPISTGLNTAGATPCDSSPVVC